MTPDEGAKPINLPRWYARFSTRTVGSSGTAVPDTVHAGPLTVFSASAGCEIAVFGEHDSVALFDGFLFDRRELAKSCGVDVDAPTAQIIAEAYSQFGDRILEQLDGCYLVAIWDASQRRLLVGHDALGRHPVFYASTASALWFGSNILSLSASGNVSREPNRISLALAMLRYWPETGETFFQHVRRLQPGHCLRVSESLVVSERKYWDPLPDDDEPWLPEAQVLAEFEPALSAAVARCMALEPQGIMLSGGVDSVTIAALAAEYLRAHGLGPLVGVSGQTGLALSPEESMQRRVTDALGMEHDVSTLVDWRAGQNDVELSLAISGELPSPTSIYWVGTYVRFYRRTAARQIHTLLTGAGGDNWLGVAHTHVADLLGRMRLLSLSRFLSLSRRSAGYSFETLARRTLWENGVRPHVDSLWALIAPDSKARFHQRRWQRALPAWLCPDPDLQNELLERLVARRTPSLTATGKVPQSYYRHSLRRVAHSYMHHENETSFHIGNWCGVRLLSPYHDKRLVSFFNRISPDTLSLRNRYKGLLRPVVAARLPGLGLENQRKESSTDDGGESLRELRDGIEHVWPDQGFQTLHWLGVLDAGRAAGLVDRVRARGFDDLTRMFTMMNTERWLKARTDA